MRIAMYTEGLSFDPQGLEEQPLGGAETAFVSLAREFARLGHQVAGFCLCEREGRFHGVDYFHASRFEPFRGQAECDFFLCSRYLGALGRPVKSAVSCLWAHDYPTPELGGALTAVRPHLDAIYVLTEYHRRAFRDLFPSLRLQYHKNGNGIDVQLIDSIRESAGERQHRAMYVSRPERGLLRALEVYAALGDRRLELVACTYKSFSDPNLQALETACAERIQALRNSGFPVRTEAFGKRDLYRHLAESKLVVYPTDFPEVFCISALEAQACGAVFLASDDFALQETVCYERFDANDPQAFVQAARRVLDDDRHRSELAAQGLAFARRFTWERVARKFLEDRQKLLDGRLKSLRIPPAARQPAAPSPRRRSAFARPRGGISGRPPGSPQAMSSPAAPRRARLGRALRKKTLAADAVGSAPAVLKGQAPKISCLTVTKDRLILLKEAIRCYCGQTYANRELVIVAEGSPRLRQALEAYVRSLGRSDIRLVFCDVADPNLGKARNLSLESARGDIVCQWDDDDLNHPLRLARQAEALLSRKADACFLNDHLHFYEPQPERRMSWIDWSYDGQVEGVGSLVPGTMMMFADSRFRYPESGPYCRRGEDSAILEALHEQRNVTGLSGEGHLLVYRYHGRNTFPRDHHLAFTSASDGFVTSRARALMRSLDDYPLPMPYVFVMADGRPFFVRNDGGCRP